MGVGVGVGPKLLRPYEPVSVGVAWGVAIAHTNRQPPVGCIYEPYSDIRVDVACAGSRGNVGRTSASATGGRPP